jgi:hypothetical protein
MPLHNLAQHKHVVVLCKEKYHVLVVLIPVLRVQVIHNKQAKDNKGTEVTEHNTNQVQALSRSARWLDETRKNLFFQ